MLAFQESLLFRAVLVVVAGSLWIQCNPEPPRRPAQKPSETLPGGRRNFEQEPRPDPRVQAEEKEQPKGEPTKPTTNSPAKPGGSEGPTLRVTPYFKQGTSTVGGRQGSWNLSCVSLHGSSGGDALAESFCNKKQVDSCYVIAENSRGVARTVALPSADGKISLKYEVTGGPTQCNGTDESDGFGYPGSVPEVFSTTGADSANRFKCGMQKVNDTYRYKVCMEDNLAQSFRSDPLIWDFNDLVLVIESPNELVFEGLTCQSQDVFSAGDDTCP